MDNSFLQPETNTQKQRGFLLAGRQIFDNALNWLAGHIQMTEEEQRDAGIYLGEQPQENRD
jgi:hypothetical protein